MPDNEIIKLLTEDIQAHRDYIHRLYKTAFTAGAVLVAICITAGYWFLGKQIDTSVLDYRIVDNLKERSKVAANIAIEEAKENAKKQIAQYVTEEIGNKVGDIVQPEIEKLSTGSFLSIVKKSTLPSGAVIAFDRESGCPTGWEEYKRAYGRFIRGIDKSGSNIDPEGARKSASFQEDAFQGHYHNLRFRQHAESGSNVRTDSFADFTNSSNHAVRDPVSDGVNGTPRTSSETRPKNVALLYCIKK